MKESRPAKNAVAKFRWGTLHFYDGPRAGPRSGSPYAQAPAAGRDDELTEMAKKAVPDKNRARSR